MAMNAHIATENPTAASKPSTRLDRVAGRLSLSPSGGFIASPPKPPIPASLPRPNLGPPRRGRS